MGQHVLKSSEKLGAAIKKRRNELNLTIETAAQKAGVGTKTWSRYESGRPIRKDKCKSLCKALNWQNLPEEDSESSEAFQIDDYKQNKLWSQYLANVFGEDVAASFIIGSSILLDNVQQDLDEISVLPKGSHVGQLDCSWIKDDLPPQFLMQYDYEFLYALKTTIIDLQNAASHGRQIIAHSVIEELVLYLMMEESDAFMELLTADTNSTDLNDADFDNSRGVWAFDICDDMDLVTFLYSERYLDYSHPYHFKNWFAHNSIAIK